MRAVLRMRRVPEPDREEGPEVQLRALRHQAVRAPGLAVPYVAPLISSCIGTMAARTRIATARSHTSRLLVLRWPQVYAQSNRGKEVRLAVQRLNAERGRQEEAAACAPPAATHTAPTADMPQTGASEDWSAYVAPKVTQPYQWQCGNELTRSMFKLRTESGTL